MCGIYNMSQMNLPVKQNQRHREQTGACQAVGRGGGMEWEVAVSRYILSYIERVKNKVLLIA